MKMDRPGWRFSTIDPQLEPKTVVFGSTGYGVKIVTMA
jgi:hypothetical protein